MINAALGGMRMPKVPPAAIVPAARLSAYLYLRIDGMATFAIVATVASELPDTAANPPLAAIVAMARPPRWCPSQASAASYRSSDKAAR